MSNTDERRRSVLLAAAGDVSTGHEPPESVFTHVNDALRSADIRFAQVERLYSERGSFQTCSDGVHSRQHPRLAAAFKTVPFDVLSIGSNHTGDWGPEAVDDTVETFRKLGIPTIGAGHNISEARQEVVLQKNGLRIAFLGYVSVLPPHYWATEERAGAVPMRAHTFFEPYEYQPGAPARIVTIPDQRDLELLTEDVRRAKKSADVVVVSLHWGVHYTSRPAEYQPIVAHAAIDAGASVILGHHAHQLQGIEIYKGGCVFYSLGNLAFNRNKKRVGVSPWCVPNGKYRHQEVYSIEPDPGHYYDYRRHWTEGGIAFIEIDHAGVKRVVWQPTIMDAGGQPGLVSPGDPQFESCRRFLEWLSEKLPTGGCKIGVRNEQYTVYEREKPS